MKSLDQKIKGLSASRRKRVEARAAQLVGEEMTLTGAAKGAKSNPGADSKSAGDSPGGSLTA